MPSRTGLVGCAVLLVAVASSTAPAQATAQASPTPSIGLLAGPLAAVQVTSRSTVVVPVIADMASAAGADLAALTANVSWNSARLRLDSIGAGTFGSITSNVSKSATGAASFSVFAVNGTPRTVTVARLYFTATASVGTSDVTISPTVAGNEVGKPVLALLKPRALRVCVANGATPCAAR